MIAFLLIGGIGFFLLVLTWFLGELFDLGHGIADFFGDHLGDMAGGDHHVGSAGAEHGPSPLSSRVIFAFMTAFGAGGASASLYHLPTLASVGVAFGAGLVLGGLVYALSVVIHGQQSSSGFELASLVGRSGRVVVSIPRDGTGQVLVGVGGGTNSLLARSRDGSPVPVDGAVRVVEVRGDLLLVEPDVQPARERVS